MEYLGVIVSCLLLVGGVKGPCTDVYTASKTETTKLLCSNRLRDEVWRFRIIAEPDHTLWYECREVQPD
jgi:hypothetical protein